MILFVGQVARDMREREAFQELDYRAVFGTMAKWATEIDDPARIPEIISRAFYTATSGRPGPVVIALPEDMLTERVAVADAPPFEPVETWPGLDRHERGCRRCSGRRSGRSCCSAAAAGRRPPARRVQRFAERFALPVATTFRRAHLFDADASELCRRSRHRPQSEAAGAREGRRSRDPGRRPARRDAVAGLHAARHSDAADRRSCTCIPDVEELGRVYRADACDQRRADRLRGRARRPAAAERHCAGRDETQVAHADYPRLDRHADQGAGRRSIWARSSVGCATSCRPTPIITNGAGNFSVWVHRFYRYPPLRHRSSRRSPARWATACRRRSALKRLDPERTVVCFAGDGDFLMTGQEFATAVQYDLPIIVVVMDNGMYGTIRMHQEREYPGPRRRHRAAESGLRRLCAQRSAASARR